MEFFLKGKDELGKEGRRDADSVEIRSRGSTGDPGRKEPVLVSTGRLGGGGEGGLVPGKAGARETLRALGCWPREERARRAILRKGWWSSEAVLGYVRDNMGDLVRVSWALEAWGGGTSVNQAK